MKRYIIVIFVLLVVALIVLRKKAISRIEIIDFMNAQVGHGKGIWVKLADDELRQVYKGFALVKQGVKPNDSEWLKIQDIFKKYNIALS